MSKLTYEELEAKLRESRELAGHLARAYRHQKDRADRKEALADELGRRLRLALYGEV